MRSLREWCWAHWGGKELTPEKLDQIAECGATVVGWQNQHSNAESIRAIHDRGWKAWVWTVDDPERALKLVQAGADGIITNRPAEIRQALESAQAVGTSIDAATAIGGE